MMMKNKTDETYFITRSFTSVIEEGIKEPPRRKIAGAFLYENTNTYFYSRTNMGKSIFAFQIAYAAATGTNIDFCSALRNECEPMKVILLDLEMDAKTISDRHKSAILSTVPERLSNLVYLHERTDKKTLIGFNLIEMIERAVLENQAKLVIIDNISKLLPDSLKAETVTMVISALNRIREKTGASFLVIGHSIKGDVKTAISPSSYYGSSMLANFFPELFYLDATNDGRFFLSHVKTKHEESYIETVPVLTRGEHPVCGLGFTFQMLMPLSDVQLPAFIGPDKTQRKINLSNFRHELELLRNGGVRQSRIAALCNVTRSTVSRFFEG
jgi:hypothetical protein